MSLNPSSAESSAQRLSGDSLSIADPAKRRINVAPLEASSSSRRVETAPTEATAAVAELNAQMWSDSQSAASKRRSAQKRRGERVTCGPLS